MQCVSVDCLELTQIGRQTS